MKWCYAKTVDIAKNGDTNTNDTTIAAVTATAAPPLLFHLYEDVSLPRGHCSPRTVLSTAPPFFQRSAGVVYPSNDVKDEGKGRRRRRRRMRFTFEGHAGDDEK